MPRNLTIPDEVLDLQPWVGQRTSTFRFQLVNAVTGKIEADLTPLRDSPPTLNHDTSRTIKRQLSGLSLGVADSARVDVIQSRVLVSMTVGGRTWPLGRFMFTDRSSQEFTSGQLTNATLFDEMFTIDQELETSVSAQFASVATGGNAVINNTLRCSDVITQILDPFDIETLIEPSPYLTTSAWPAGTYRGVALEDLSVQGDWFSPWIDNANRMRFIRTFDPADELPTIDLDAGNTVFRDSIVATDDVLSAPNRFIVVNNLSADDGSIKPIIGRYDVPSSAPHSILNRGFVIPQNTELPLTSVAQASAVARNLGIRQTVVQRVNLATAPDPRHDSYDVIRWQGVNWLELGWSLTCIEGGSMTHDMRRAFT